MESGQSFGDKTERNNEGDFIGLFWESSLVPWARSGYDDHQNNHAHHSNFDILLPVAAAVKTLHNLDIWEFPPQNEPVQLYADRPGL